MFKLDNKKVFNGFTTPAPQGLWDGVSGEFLATRILTRDLFACYSLVIDRTVSRSSCLAVDDVICLKMTVADPLSVIVWKRMLSTAGDVGSVRQPAYRRAP